MGSIKQQALETVTEDTKSHKLTEQEINYLKLQNLTLQYHSLQEKLMSGFLYYVATTRLGYSNGVDIQFSLDLDSEDKLITIKTLPPASV